MVRDLFGKRNRNYGFSLVELIVVVLIIAIIAVTVAPSVMKWAGTAKENVDSLNATTIKNTVSEGVAEFLKKGTGSVNDSFDICSDSFSGCNTTNPTSVRDFVYLTIDRDYPVSESNGFFTVTIVSSSGVSVSYVDHDGIVHTK